VVRAGVVSADQHVDGLFGFVARQRSPPGGALGQVGVQKDHSVVVVDEVGAGHDRSDDALTDLSLRKQGGHQR
jgi:hypothetical protein